MKKLYNLLLLLLAMLTVAKAQTTTGKISGTVTHKGMPVENATVELLANDSILVRTAVAAKEGKYTFLQLQDGMYILRVSGIGYSIVEKKITVATGITISIDVELETEARQLSAVTVTAQKKLIEVRADKMVVNVDASPSNTGANALEVLEKSPGVLVDKDGVISLQGKAGVAVMIDGKPTYMSSADLANYLRSLNASQVDQVELITQPSARFDAQGNAGIINIKLKRNKVSGMNGSAGFSYTQGVYKRLNGNGMLSYRSGKWNTTASYSVGDIAGFNDIHLLRYFRAKNNKELKSIFDQQSFLKYLGTYHNVKLGVDFLATQKTTIGLNLQAGFNHLDFTIPTDMKIYDPGKTYTGSAITHGKNKMNRENLAANLNIKTTFDSTGRELTADVDYVRYYNGSDQAFENYFYDANGQQNSEPYLLRGSNPSFINIYSGKMDYVHPLQNKLKLEAGVKASLVRTDNNSKFENKNSGQWEPDARTNHFIYDENIGAAYLNLSKSWNKWQVQAGLRLEHTQSNGDQRTSNQQFERKYTQLFPTAFVSYQVSDDHTVTINAGRRIGRPNYADLNPFQLLLNPYTYQQGNPLLQPQFSYNSALGYTYKNGLFTAKVGYTQTKDIITDVLIQDEAATVSYATIDNAARQEDWTLQLGLNVSPKKIWTTSLFGTVNALHFSGQLSGYYHDIRFTSFTVNMNNQFKLNKGWSGEIGGYFQSDNLFGGNSKGKAFGQLNAGISKQVFNKKGTIRLTARDIFKTQRFNITQNYHEFESYFTNNIDSRTITIGFTWRFAKNEKNVLKQRETGASADEQNRIGQ